MEIMAHYSSEDTVAEKRFKYFFEKYDENIKNRVNEFITAIPET